MPISFKLTGISVSGTDVRAAQARLNGVRDPRLLVRNAGDAALAGARVFVKESATGSPALVNDTKFSTLPSAGVEQLVVPGPVEVLELRVDAPTATALDVTVLTGLEP